MLILSRKTNESIVIDGRIIVKILRVEGEVVKVGIEAPSDIPVHRQEIYDAIQRNNREALTQGRPVPPKLPARSTLLQPGGLPATVGHAPWNGSRGAREGSLSNTRGAAVPRGGNAQASGTDPGLPAQPQQEFQGQQPARMPA